MITTSLKTASEVHSPEFVYIPKTPQFSNYAKALSTGNWPRWFFNTLWVSVVSTVFSLLFNSMAGFAFARLEFKFKDFLFYTILIGLMVTPQLTILPTFIIMKNFPLAGGNNIFGSGGSGFINTYSGLILPILAGAFGVFLCRQFYLNFPKSLDDAALMDGASLWAIFTKVYLPNSKPVLLSLTILKCTYTWNDYMWPLVMTQSDKIMTLQLGLTRFKDQVIEWELLMAASTVVMLPLVIAFLFTQKYIVKGIVTTGIKG